MEQGIFYIAVGVAIILGTLVGRYVFPNISETVSSALNLLSAYPMLMKWGTAACQYIKQYLDNMSGEDKNKKAAEMIMELAKQVGLEITEEQARSIAQAAYEAMKKEAENSKPAKEQVSE